MRTTSTGLGLFPLWSTKFLWVQIVHKIVKIDCSKLDFICPGILVAVMWLWIHYFAETWSSSVVLMPKGDPYQTALAKGCWRKRWDIDSSSSSHIRHLLDVRIPLLLRFANTGKLLCKNFQIKVRIFIGSFTFQIIFQADCGTSSVLWVVLVGWILELLNQRISLGYIVLPWSRVLPYKLIQVDFNFGYENLANFCNGDITS